MSKIQRHIFICFLFIICLPFVCVAEEIKPQFEFARQGNNILAAVQYAIPEGYHAYANVPGGTGLPTKLVFTLEGEGEMPVLYPAGKSEKDIFDPSVTVNVYEGDITLLAVLPPGSADKMYAVRLDMLLCSTSRCQPVKESFAGQVPPVNPLLTDAPWEITAMALLAQENDSSGALSLEEGQAPPPRLEVSANNIPLEANQGADEDLNFSLSPQYANTSLEIYGLGKALMLGLLAGLLLNAMPCVLPVLTIKISGLLLMGSQDRKAGLKQFREHNIFFAAGILTFFTALSVLLGVADLMWGQLYQSEALLLIMLLLVFLMGLSMLGVFTLPAFDLRMGVNTRNRNLQSYLTGFISTFLATPCSGPLLGGVLAWAFAQPLPILTGVFWAVGLGMALPYLVFCIWPGMTKILPRPGNWMYVFEHILGFLLLGTSLYLLSILPSQKYLAILGMLLLVSMGAWLWGKFCGLDAPLLRRRVAGWSGIFVLCLAVWWALLPAKPQPRWQNFSPAQFSAELGNRNMLVEFTADWCPNCKFVEATVLTENNLRKWQKRYDLALVKVDLTSADAPAEDLLRMLGSKSIPLTAIFARGSSADRPLVLRDIYNTSALESALKKTLEQS